MTDLIKMTEEKIKMYKDYGKHPKTKKYFYISEITNLKEVLSEIKKRNCEGCKHNEWCEGFVKIGTEESQKGFELTYCSNWEAKKEVTNDRTD